MNETKLNPDIIKERSVRLEKTVPDKETPAAFHSRVQLYDIFNENNEKMGYVGISENPTNSNEVLISGIDILFTSESKFKNQGYGLLVYKKIAKIITNTGKRFVSSSLANPFASKVWEQLFQEGIAKKDSSKQKWDSGLYYID